MYSYVNTHTYMFICLYVCVYVCILVYMCVCMCMWSLQSLSSVCFRGYPWQISSVMSKGRCETTFSLADLQKGVWSQPGEDCLVSSACCIRHTELLRCMLLRAWGSPYSDAVTGIHSWVNNRAGTATSMELFLSYCLSGCR